jgi:hypothetical protein
MDAATRRLVRERAHNTCEYCQLHQDQSPLARLQIEHIIPRKHRGTDNLANLAMAGVDCNLGKGANVAGIDELTGQLTPLFHPRRDLWEDHFEWDGAYLSGKTAVGQVTIKYSTSIRKIK